MRVGCKASFGFVSFVRAKECKPSTGSEPKALRQPRYVVGPQNWRPERSCNPFTFHSRKTTSKALLALPLRRGPLLAVAWSGRFGPAQVAASLDVTGGVEREVSDESCPSQQNDGNEE